MNKIITMVIAGVFCLLASSCGGGIQPADPAITYSVYTSSLNDYKDIPLNGCFEVEKVSATTVPDDEFSSIQSQISATIKIKTVKAPSQEIKAAKEMSAFGKIELLDKDEAVLDKISWGIGLHDLFTTSEGDVTILSGTTSGLPNNQAKEMLDKIKYIRLAGVCCGIE